MPFKNMDMAQRFLKGMSPKAKLAMVFATGMMAAKAKKHCVELISLDDHTLKDLAKMGHPYALRHGPNGMGLHDPNVQVHVQSGALLAGLKVVAPTANAQGARAGVINTCEYDAAVQDGNEVMIARPYMAYVRAHNAEDIIKTGADEFAHRMGLGGEVADVA